MSTTLNEEEVWAAWSAKVQAKVTDPDWLAAAYEALKDRPPEQHGLNGATGHTLRIEHHTWEAWKELARKRGTGPAALTREAMRTFLEADKRTEATQSESQSTSHSNQQKDSHSRKQDVR